MKLELKDLNYEYTMTDGGTAEGFVKYCSEHSCNIDTSLTGKVSAFLQRIWSGKEKCHSETEDGTCKAWAVRCLVNGIPYSKLEEPEEEELDLMNTTFFAKG